MSIDPVVQDDQVDGGPTISLRLVLAMMRVLGGEEGASRVEWSGQGFGYVLRAQRLDGDDPLPEPAIDHGHGESIDEALALLRAYFAS